MLDVGPGWPTAFGVLLPTPSSGEEVVTPSGLGATGCGQCTGEPGTLLEGGDMMDLEKEVSTDSALVGLDVQRELIGVDPSSGRR